MHILVLIRKYKSEDEHKLSDLIKNYVMSHANEAFTYCLFREVKIIFFKLVFFGLLINIFFFLFQFTLQLIVLLSAIMFIFFGVPLKFCFFTIPAVIIFLYFAVYVNYFNKSHEILFVSFF